MNGLTVYIVSTEVQEAFERHDKDTEEIVGAMNESEAPPLEINEIEIKARDVDKIGELLTGNREDDPDAVLEDPVSIPTSHSFSVFNNSNPQCIHQP